MRKIFRRVVVVVLFFAAVTVYSAEDIEFKFEIPPLPYPPIIKDIQTSAAMQGSPTFTVSVQIEASEQKKGICYVGGSPVLPPDEPNNHVECEELTAWKQEKHPDISPNPPNIKKVLLYYYKNGDTSTTAAPITMTYDPVTKLAMADVPIASDSNTTTFYIVAVDHFGNVSSQVPDTANAPCVPGTTTWDPSLSTPAWETCSQVTQYEECSSIKNGTPTCSSSYTTNDRLNDTCGEPNPTTGKQSLLATQVPKVDIYGISAGADADYFCIRMGLGAAPPPTSDNPPIEGYLAVFFNPDMPDSNPGDTHIENAYAITYAPEAAGSDPTLVRVLWDVECISNPNTADPLGCKIKAAIPGDTDLSMGYKDGALMFITKKSWGTNQLIGSSSKLAQIIALTGEINLSGDNLFWLVDMTSGLGFYHKNTTTTICAGTDCGPIDPRVRNLTAECNIEGASGSGTSVCPMSFPKPPGNDCVLSFLPPLDRGFIGKYKIYVANSENAITDANKASYYIGEIAENGSSSSYTYIHAVSGDDLDGQTRYYKITAVNGTDSSKETSIQQAAKTTCAPEDWEFPSPVIIVSGETPEDNTKKCEIRWTADTKADTSITGFYVLRDGSLLTNFPVPAIAGMGHSDYTYSHTDASAALENGTSYTYAVRTEDRGGNFSEDSTVVCTPEDKKPPSDVTGVLSLNKSTPSQLKARVTWDANSEEDLAGYRVFMCQYSNSGDCSIKGDYAKISGDSLLTDTVFEYTGFAGEGSYQFYIEAEDTSGNSSELPCFGCVNKAYITVIVDPCSPSFVDTSRLKAEALPEGGTCKITWERVCTNANPGPDCPATFDCDSPPPEHLIGYQMVMKLDDCSSMPYPSYALPSEKQGFVPPIASKVPEKTVRGLTNGRNYCFLPFSVDANDNYPPPPAPAGVLCIPDDITPPGIPVMKGVSCDENACTPSWESVDEPDTITFSVYRCEGEAADCAVEGDFEKLVENIAEGTLQYADGSVDGVSEYTYCVTARDPWGNESAVIGDENCKTTCKTEVCVDPPASSDCMAIFNNTGCKFWYGASGSNNDPLYAGQAGYNVYLCTNGDPASCDKVSGKVNSEGVLKQVYSSSLSAYQKTGMGPGVRYCGVTFVNSAGVESDIVVSDSTCEIIPKPTEGTCAGRKEIGNPTCDDVVDFDDFMELRNAYDTKSGESKYRTWADFNGDSEVDFDDFMILRNNYEKKVTEAVCDDPTGVFCCKKKPGESGCCAIDDATGECK